MLDWMQLGHLYSLINSKHVELIVISTAPHTHLFLRYNLSYIQMLHEVCFFVSDK